MSKPKCSSSSFLCKGDKGYACIPKGNTCQSEKNEVATETLNKLTETIQEQTKDESVSVEEAKEGLKVVAKSGQIAALGGVAAEIGMIQEINKAIGKDTDSEMLEELNGIRSKLGDEETDYRLEQSLKWAKENGYEGEISEVFWTARPGAMKKAGFPDVPQQKHPADLVVKFSDGKSLGISAKSSKTNNSKLTLKNRGINSLERSLGLDLDDSQKQRESKFLDKLGFNNKSELKKRMKTNKKINRQAQVEGDRVLKEIQERLVEQFNKKDPLSETLEELFLDTNDFGLPYIKVTGLESKKAKVDDPLNNPTIASLRSADSIELKPTGKSNVRILADGKTVMNIRPKYLNEKLATGVVVVAN